jgi:cytochrome P450
MHPGVGLMLERVVPDSGLQLPDGTCLPPGTNVGMNAWVVHQNRAVFGQDAASFRPERWLQQDWENDHQFARRLAKMKRSDLTFGAGKRSCLGKDVAMLETYKLIATLFLKYEIYPVDPGREWEIQNSWFIRQSGIDVTFRRRIQS